VTCSTFTDLWLNEAFAEYLQYQPFLNGRFDGVGDMESIFFLNEHYLGMNADASLQSHAIVPEFNENNFYFDDITYNKGAVVVRNIGDIVESVTNRTFLNILGDYIRDNKYLSVNTNHFFSDVKRIVGLDLQDMLGVQDWITQPNSPYLSLEVKNTGKGYVMASFRQQIYTFSNKTISDRMWKIPLRGILFTRNTITNELERLSVDLGLLESPVKEVSVSIPTNHTFVTLLLNPKRLQLFRTLYVSDILSVASIIPETSVLDRSGFIYDMIQLFLSGSYPNFSVPLLVEILDFVKYEQSPGVFLVFMQSIGRLEIALRCSIHHVAFLDWLHHILDSINKLEGILTEIKPEIFRWGLQMNETGTVQRALGMYRNGITKSSPLYGPVLEGAIRFGPNVYFESLFSRTLLKDEEILALAAVNDHYSQLKVLNRFRADYRALNMVVSQMLYYPGSSQAVWQFWSKNPIFFNGLEMLVVQLTPKLLKEAEPWAKVYPAVQIASERVSATNFLCRPSKSSLR
jgi:Peptidase family M1 domain